MGVIPAIHTLTKIYPGQNHWSTFSNRQTITINYGLGTPYDIEQEKQEEPEAK